MIHSNRIAPERHCDDGRWERLEDALRRRVRVEQGRQTEPSGAILDSQRVKTTEKGRAGLRRGQDG